MFNHIWANNTPYPALTKKIKILKRSISFCAKRHTKETNICNHGCYVLFCVLQPHIVDQIPSLQERHVFEKPQSERKKGGLCDHSSLITYMMPKIQQQSIFEISLDINFSLVCLGQGKSTLLQICWETSTSIPSLGVKLTALSKTTSSGSKASSIIRATPLYEKGYCPILLLQHTKPIPDPENIIFMTPLAWQKCLSIRSKPEGWDVINTCGIFLKRANNIKEDVLVELNELIYLRGYSSSTCNVWCFHKRHFF